MVESSMYFTIAMGLIRTPSAETLVKEIAVPPSAALSEWSTALPRL